MAHRGRTVLARDCVLAGAEEQHGRPLNTIVRRHMGINAIDGLGLIITGCLIGGIGRLMFAEYRARMSARTQEIDSVHSLFHVVSKMGRFGYVTCTAMLLGAMLVLVGLASFVITIVELVRLE